jgi:hypothetical protein
LDLSSIESAWSSSPHFSPHSEMSRYYLLGWYIDPEKLPPGKFSTIKASVKGRSDLTVRVRQGSLDLSQLVAKDAK